MSKKYYTQKEIKILKENRYIKNISSKYISFTDEFKIKGLELNIKKWKHHKEIFEEFWFPDFIINSDIPKDTFDRLRCKSKKWLLIWKKWRPKNIDISKMTKDEYITYLEAKLAIFEELKKYSDWNFP